MRHLDHFADCLIAAHRTNSRCLPHSDLPQTHAEAYYVQSRVAAALSPIAGFKTALKPGEVPIIAPILAPFAVQTGASVPLGDSMGIELEVGWKIIAPVPDPQDPDFATKLIDAVRPVPVIELVNCRMHGPLAQDPIAMLADFQINHGLVIGTPIEDWDGRDIGTVTARLQAGTDTLLTGRAHVPGGSALSTLKALISDIGGHCGGLQIGHVVITGSLHPLTYLEVPCDVHGQIESLGAVAITLS